MKIVFNAMYCGLGNNGGTQTIIQSANTLKKLGHDVAIVDSMRNQYSWGPTEVDHYIIYKNQDFKKEKIFKKISSDIIIGTGIKTLESTAIFPAKKKFHWIRGWETWQISEKDMIKLFQFYKNKVIYLTNGIGIQNKLKKYGIDSHIQYAGLDNCNLGFAYDHNYTSKINESFVIGGLIHPRHKTKNSDWLIKIHNYLKSLYDVELYTYGTNFFDTKISSKHVHTMLPTQKQKLKIYRKIDFWLSPSISEGFHIPPAEYMLTGGIVVGIDTDLNGTKSYLKNKKTGYLVSGNWLDMANKIIEIKNNHEELNEIGNNAKLYIQEEIGDRKYNMKQFIKHMEKLK
jgi:glycosyltransferase involved in cell wall biosynthesis